MPRQRLKQIIVQMPFEKKLIASGALLLAVSLFLPWYQDRDTFHTGQSFSGLTGPLYFIGFTFLALAIASMTLVLMDYFDKKTSFFPFKTTKLYLAVGIFTFYLLFTVNSIYFDRDFGVNIALKESQFGMFMAFTAAALLTVGGYLNSRDRTHILKDFEEQTRDVAPPLPIIAQQKPRENVRTVYTRPNSIPTRNPLPLRSNIPIVEQKELEKVVKEKAPQPFRMDL